MTAPRFGRAARSLMVSLATLVHAVPAVAQEPTAGEPRRVIVRWVASPYADWLAWLLGRDSTRVPSVVDAVPLTGVPTVRGLLALPMTAASSTVETYDDLRKLLEPYRGAVGRVVGRGSEARILAYSEPLPPYEALRAAVDAGEPHFPAFRAWWEATVAPRIRLRQDSLRVDLETCAAIDTLQRLARLRVPFDSLDIGLLAFHGAASANSRPRGIYTGIGGRADISWFVGHELTHLLIDEQIGRDWRRLPGGRDAQRAVVAAGGTDGDVDEAASAVMQVKVAQACGRVPVTFRIASRLGDAPVQQRIATALEADWPDFVRNPARWPTLAEFLVDRTLAALAARPGAAP